MCWLCALSLCTGSVYWLCILAAFTLRALLAHATCPACPALPCRGYTLRAHSWGLALLEIGSPGDWKTIPFTRPSSFANRATKTPNRTYRYIHNAHIDEFESPEAMKHTNDMPNSIYACDRPQTTLTVFVVCGRSHAKRILNEKLGSKPFA